MTKKILITGKNSYIGRSFIEYCKKNGIDFEIDELAVRGEEWKSYDFTSYDSVFHVAGIAHNSSDPKLEELYYQVNRDLTIAIAEKAKNDGVKQFIFMSSIIVYGTKNEFIDADTEPDPDNFYGDSKLQAEEGILRLQDNIFNVVIIRPPMIYGKGSKGNYPLLSKLSQITPFFPNYENQRSMLHIDNLTELIRLIIDNEDAGIFHPQNEEYVRTSEMVSIIAEIHNKQIYQVKVFNHLIKLLTRVKFINKIFGNLYYDNTLSQYNQNNYQINDFKNSILKTEKWDV